MLWGTDKKKKMKNEDKNISKVTAKWNMWYLELILYWKEKEIHTIKKGHHWQN